MKKQLLITLLTFTSINAIYSQFAIGNTEWVYTDTDRGNREIPVEIYYPAVTQGTNTTPASGNFPTLTIGHGFVMTIDAYYNYRDYFVPKGYIVQLVNTEGTFAPSHLDFAKDLLFASNQLKSESQLNSGFILYGHHNNLTAIMGHSMGGGATILAGSIANTGDVTTLIGLAPAETNPSAITAAGNVLIPSLIFSGEGDNVTPSSQHQLPIYSSLSSTCKIYTSIKGGGHCLFANANLLCDFGETTSGSTISITRQQQHEYTFQVLESWLDYYLYQNVSSGEWLTDSLQSNAIYDIDKSCQNLSNNNSLTEINFFKIITVQSNSMLIQMNVKETTTYLFSIYDLSGKLIIQQEKKILKGDNTESIILPELSSGYYFLQLSSNTITDTLKFVIP